MNFRENKYRRWNMSGDCMCHLCGSRNNQMALKKVWVLYLETRIWTSVSRSELGREQIKVCEVCFQNENKERQKTGMFIGISSLIIAIGLLIFNIYSCSFGNYPMSILGVAWLFIIVCFSLSGWNLIPGWILESAKTKCLKKAARKRMSICFPQYYKRVGTEYQSKPGVNIIDYKGWKSMIRR